MRGGVREASMTDASAHGTRLLVEQEHGRGVVQPFLDGRVYSYSARCPDKPRPNEDAAAIVPIARDAGLLAVADGLGGQPGAEQASGIAVRALATLACEPPAPGELSSALLRIIENASEQVAELGVGAGTTLVLAAVEDSLVRPMHVGDSTALMTDSSGRVKLTTVPHSPIGYALEAGLLTEEQALCHPDRHIISNMVGSPVMRIEVGPPIAFEAGDTLLLASDGVTDNLYFAELVAMIHAGSIERCGEVLARTCRDRMEADAEGEPCKPDDLTFLLFRRS